MWNNIRPAPIRTSSEKLIELRLKTDRDLKSLLEKGVERALQLLGHGDRKQAESTYAQAVTLLRLVRTLPPWEQRRLERQIGELRAELDQAAPWGRAVRPPAGSNIGTTGVAGPH